MATTKISALTAHTTTDGAEELLINDGGTSKKVTIANLLHDNSIDSDHYVDGSIDNAHLADDAVGVAELSATGTASSSTFLRGDNAWATPAAASTATASATGVIKIEDDTDQSVAAESVSTTANRTYGLQLNSSDQGVVNVPWTDTNTTYSVTDGELSQNNFTNTLKTKLDGIEASADVTDATNVTAAGALMDSELAGIAAVKATTGTFLSADESKLDGIEASADVTDATNVAAAGALMDSECAGLAAVKATTGTFLSADESKLDGIEASADVTDATNVASAGAGMLTVDQSWSGSQRGTPSTVTDGTLDLNTANNFQYTPSGADVFEFSNETAGQSGFVKLINPSAHSISVGSEVKKGESWDVSTAGTYLVSYYTDGTNVYVSASEALS